MNDSHLKAEVVFKGIRFPTSMAFLGPNDILVLEKNEGTVRRIVNGAMLQHPLLHVNVANDGERGLLGIAVSKTRNSSSTNDITTYVFLYYTELGQRKSGNISGVTQPAAGNRLYRYELVDNKLVNPKLLLDLPATPGPYHNGGKVVIGPDNNVYVVIGDVFGHRTKAQNFVNGADPDGTSGILRITQDGKVVGSSSANGILGNKFPLNLYYAYGIRNSFGMDFDPLTGRLWDTENGPAYGDEINLVQPGFNSGWEAIQGIWRPVSKHLDTYAGSAVINPNNLVTFNGKGKYRPPEFTWYQPVGPTTIKFLDSDKLGKRYQNDIFVADFHQGNIYHFKLNQNRTGLILNGTLAGKVADSINDLKGVVFGHGFGGITDMQLGPDGYLYVLSLYEGGNNCAAILHVNTPCILYTSSLQGTIFRIIPTNAPFVR